jgi:uncharacterized BrkB/YihY/UPF0761 family membrane protein
LGHIPIRYALAGGVTAAVLWEIIRHILVWYYSTISLVNVIYGSLATAVVALLSIEIAVIILLLGAQVIAEFEHSISETAEPGQSRLDGCNLAIKPDALTLTPAEKSEIEKAL